MLDELQVGRVLPTDLINKNDIKTARLQDFICQLNMFFFLKKAHWGKICLSNP